QGHQRRLSRRGQARRALVGGGRLFVTVEVVERAAAEERRPVAHHLVAPGRVGFIEGRQRVRCPAQAQQQEAAPRRGLGGHRWRAAYAFERGDRQFGRPSRGRVGF